MEVKGIIIGVIVGLILGLIAGYFIFTEVNISETKGLCGNNICDEGEKGSFDSQGVGCAEACAEGLGCTQVCGESFCPKDCGYKAVCGDGICEGFEKHPPSFPDEETNYYCPEDCE